MDETAIWKPADIRKLLNEVSSLRAENAKLKDGLIWARLVHPEIVRRAKEGSLHAEELLGLAPDIVSAEGELVR